MPPAWFAPVGRCLSSVLAKLQDAVRVWFLWVLSAGPIPSHIAFIMDGNRRFADRLHVDRHMGHSLGYDALLRTLKDCFDLRVKTVTLFAFSIDNFQRSPDEVSALMDLMQTKIETLVEKEGLASEYGIQVRVLGDLSLLPPGARIAAEKAMAVTSKNSSAVLNLCISYTSTREIVQSIQRTCVNVVNALGGADGSSGALDKDHMCDRKICVVPNSENGNGHAVWSQIRTYSIDQPGESLSSRTLNGDLDCSHGHSNKWHGGTDKSDSISANACHGMQDGLGVYEQFCNCDNAHATTSCNGCDVDDMSDCDFVCKNGSCRTWDEWVNNSEVSSKDVMDVESRMYCGHGTLPKAFACEVADSSGLRNRTYRKVEILKNSVSQDLDSALMHECSSNERHRCACEENGRQQCMIGSSNPNSSRKLQGHSCQGSVLRRKAGNTLKNVVWSNCICGNHFHLCDRVLKVVKDYVSEEELEKHMYTGSCPLPDLLIRTSGETRLSNFLLWQASFSHLAFCKVFWPEFSFRHLFFILLEYQRSFYSPLRKLQYNNTAQPRH